MRPKCPDCGDHHEKWQAHIWSKRVVEVSKEETGIRRGIGIQAGVKKAEITAARDEVAASPRERREALPDHRQDQSVHHTSPRTMNRRSRQAYNAYMREYMRKARARKKAEKEVKGG